MPRKTGVLKRASNRCGVLAIGTVLTAPGCIPAGHRAGAPASYSSGQCAAISVSVNEKVWNGGGVFGSPLASVAWPASGDWKDSVQHWCVHNNNLGDNIPDFAMHVLCGVESNLGQTAEFELEKRTGYDGPALHFSLGWSFITFHWPLIWMKNIQAGSIGTTAISRRTSDTAQTYLIRNAVQIDTNLLTSDCDTGLSMDSGTTYPVETFEFEPGSNWDVVMCQHHKIPASQYFAPQGAGSGSGFACDLWYFDVAVDQSDALVVTPEDPSDPVAAEAAAFLLEVLTIAREQEIYGVPINCPQGGP